MHIEKLELSPLIKKGLAEMGIKTVWQLCVCTENGLLANPNLGRKGTDEIIDFLKRNALTLALRNPQIKH